MYVTKNESGMVEWYADAEMDTRYHYNIICIDTVDQCSSSVC